MRRFIAGAFLILVIPLAATAQEYPTAEVFGGYSYLRADADGIGLNGWNGSITGTSPSNGKRGTGNPIKNRDIRWPSEAGGRVCRGPGHS